MASLLHDVHKTLYERSSAENDYYDEFLYCVVSNDKGFCAAVNAGLSEVERANVCLYTSLNDFVQYAALLNRQAEFLKTFIESEEAVCEMEGKYEVEFETVISLDISECKVRTVETRRSIRFRR